MIDDLTACRVVALDDKIEGLEYIGEAGAGERHGLDRAEIERAVGPDKVQCWLGKQRRLLDPDRRLAAAGGDVEAPFARLAEVKAIANDCLLYTSPSPRDS